MPLNEIRNWIGDADVSEDWAGVLRWDSRIDELVAQDPATSLDVLATFADAYFHACKFDKAGLAFERVAEASGALQYCILEDEALSQAAISYMKAGEWKIAEGLFERARDSFQAQEFVLQQSKVCRWLGKLLKADGRSHEGLEENRRAYRVIQQQGVGEHDASAAAAGAQHAAGHEPHEPCFTSTDRAFFSDRAYLERAALRELVDGLCSVGEAEEAESMLRLLEGVEGGESTADSRLWSHYLRGKLHLSEMNKKGSGRSLPLHVRNSYRESAAVEFQATLNPRP